MTQEQKNLFGEALFSARTKLDLTQEQCAKHCGVSVKSYQYWERGVSEPKTEKFDLICEFLGLQGDKFV